MKKNIIALILVIAVALAIACTAYNAGYKTATVENIEAVDNAHECGYNDGHVDGWDDGWKDGYDAGLDEGKSEQIRNSTAPETNEEWYCYPVNTYSDYDRGCIDTINRIEVYRDPDDPNKVYLNVDYDNGYGLEQWDVELREAR